MRLFSAIVALTALLFTNIAISSEPMGLVAGSKSGTYYQFGKDIKSVAKVAGIALEVKESSGSIDNIRRIDSAENAALGIVQSDVLGFLKRSKEPRSQKAAKRLRLIFPFYKEEIHLIANKSIKNFDDLAGKNVVVGPSGSGSWLTAMNLFNLTNIKPDNFIRLAPEEGLASVLQGEADAMIFVAGKPVKLFSKLDKLKDNEQFSNLVDTIHFLPLNSPKMLKEYSVSKLLPEDYDIIEKPLDTIAVTAMLVSFDFSDENTSYSSERCGNITNLADALRKHIGTLQESGHPKWQEVDLSSPISSWKKDKCAHKEEPKTPEDKIENELLRLLKQ